LRAVELPLSSPCFRTILGSQYEGNDSMVGKGQSRPRAQRSLGRALIVEDDALLALALEEALIEGGARSVESCNSSAAAKVALETFRPDVVVLDVHLADCNDGWAFAEIVTQLGPRSPHIIFSTATPEAIPPEVAALGLVMAKPYRPDELVEAVRRYRRGSGLLTRLRSALA
jgi:CheY-like chemotaxis protein